MVLCAIGRYLCFALEGGPPGFPRDFSCPAVLWCHLRVSLFAYQAFTVFGTVSQQFRLRFFAGLMVLNPGKVSFTGLGFFPVRSPLLGVSRLISFPRVT